MRLLQTARAHVGRSEFGEVGDLQQGLGLFCYLYRGERAGEHDGGWLGWGTRMDMLPDRGFGVVVLTNRDPSPVPEMLCHVVFDRLCGKEPIDWFEEFRIRRRQFLAHQEENRRARAAARRKGTRPSHALEQYAGEYEHPGYGRIGIAAIDGRLHWRFRGIAGPLAAPPLRCVRGAGAAR